MEKSHINRWDFSPEGDGIEDDEQSNAAGSEGTLKQLFYRKQSLQPKKKSPTFFKSVL